MIKKSVCISIFIIIIFISLTGCWDYSDLDEKNLPLVGIYDIADYSDQDNNKLIIGAIFPSLEENIEKEYKIEFIQGQTIGETREARAFSSSEIFAIGMLQTAIYGEELAKKGLNNITDVLLRMPKISNALSMAIIEGDSRDLQNIKLKENIDLGLFITNILKNAQKSAFFPTITLHLYAVDDSIPGRNPIMPLIKIKNNSSIELSGTGLLKNDKLIAKIGLEDTRSLVLLRGIKSRGNIPFTIEENGKIIDEGTITVRNSRKVKVIRNGDDYTFFIYIKLTGRLIEHFHGNIILSENPKQSIESIEKTVEKKIKAQCENFIKKMQNEFKVDCIHISKYALAKWRPELEKKIDEGFIENVKIIVNVKVNIKDIGDST